MCEKRKMDILEVIVTILCATVMAIFIAGTFRAIYISKKQAHIAIEKAEITARMELEYQAKFIRWIVAESK